MLHATYNLVTTLVPVQVKASHDWPFQLVFTSHSQLVTGGQYGADCSLVNVMAYLVIIAWLVVMIRLSGTRTNV